jgi:succinoglycan biosynthesis protein ExoO
LETFGIVLAPTLFAGLSLLLMSLIERFGSSSVRCHSKGGGSVLPKVSVIVPAHNVERYVEGAVASALAQTLGELEVIVVDDASDDDTARVVAAIGDRRLQLLRNERNGGPAQARNRALQAAKGEWIAFLDADDWFAPERLEVLLRLATEAGTDLVADDMYLIRDGADRPWGTTLSHHRVRDGEIIDALRFLTMDRGLQPIIRRRFLVANRLKFNEGLRTGEDNLLILNCLLAGGRLAITTEPLYYYRTRAGSLTGDRIGSLFRSREVFQDLLRRREFIQDADLRTAAEAKLVKISHRLQFYQVIQPFRQGEVRKAVIEAWRNPSFFLLLFKSLPAIFRHRLAWLRPPVQRFKFASWERNQHSGDST